MQPTTIEKYFRETKNPVYVCLYVLPLFLVYELLAMTLNTFQITNLRNGADVMLRNMVGFIGLDKAPFLIFFILLTLAVIAGYYKKKYRTEVVPGFFPLLFIESILYALILGSVALNTTNLILGLPKLFALSLAPMNTDFLVSLMLSLGAGIHEEFFFRFLAIEASLLLGRTLFRDYPKEKIYPWNALFALVFSSLLFSYFHYLGPYGDSLDIDSFVFRAVSGIYLSILYLFRGFGVAAWTHALYDVFLLTGIL